MDTLNQIPLFFFHYCVDTSASEILIHDGVIRQVVSVSGLTWCIRYIHY